MGKCISKGPNYKHDDLKKQFSIQIENKIKKKLKKMKTDTTGLKINTKFKRQSSKTTFKMKDFVNKNYNSLIEEYR